MYRKKNIWNEEIIIIELKDNKSELLYDKEISKKYKVNLRKIGENEKISIVSDTMFRTMFNNEKRIKYSAKLISYFLDIEYERLLNNIRLVKNDIDKESYSDKGESSRLCSKNKWYSNKYRSK